MMHPDDPERARGLWHQLKPGELLYIPAMWWHQLEWGRGWEAVGSCRDDDAQCKLARREAAAKKGAGRGDGEAEGGGGGGAKEEEDELVLSMNWWYKLQQGTEEELKTPGYAKDCTSCLANLRGKIVGQTYRSLGADDSSLFFEGLAATARPPARQAPGAYGVGSRAPPFSPGGDAALFGDLGPARAKRLQTHLASLQNFHMHALGSLEEVRRQHGNRERRGPSSCSPVLIWRWERMYLPYQCPPIPIQLSGSARRSSRTSG